MKRSSIASASGPTLRKRLAESLETALRLSGGTARLAFLPSANEGDSRKPVVREEIVFSNRHARLPRVRLQRADTRNRGCSPSTIPRAPCPQLRWHRQPRNSSIRRASWRIRICRSRAALCVAGTAATRTNFQMIQSLAQHYKFDIEGRVERSASSGAAGAAVTAVARTSWNSVTPSRAASWARRKHKFEGIMPKPRNGRYSAKPSPPRYAKNSANISGTHSCPDCQGHAAQSHGAQRLHRRRGAAHRRAFCPSKAR